MAPKRKKISVPLNRRVIYIGPTLDRGLLVQFAVFKDGEFPEAIEKLRAKSPALRGLFIPVESLADSRRRINTRGDILHAYAARLALELKEK